jgi:hypothetical protein
VHVLRSGDSALFTIHSMMEKVASFVPHPYLLAVHRRWQRDTRIFVSPRGRSSRSCARFFTESERMLQAGHEIAYSGERDASFDAGLLRCRALPPRGRKLQRARPNRRTRVWRPIRQRGVPTDGGAARSGWYSLDTFQPWRSSIGSCAEHTAMLPTRRSCSWRSPG